jgi:hypothetical protein
MWTRKYSKIYQGIKKEDVWQIWTNINHWTDWHDDLESCKMEGKFIVGNHFVLKPKGAPMTFKIVLTEIVEGQKFTDCTHFFGARMYDTHEFEETPEGLRLSNTLQVTGPLAWLWIQLVAKNVANSISQENEALIKLLRLRHGQ